MKVTKKTRVGELLPLLNEERMRQLSQEVPAQPLERPLLKMTCGEFIAALDEGYAMSFFGRRERALVAFGRYRQFLTEMEGVTAYIRRYEVEQSGEEKAAAQGVSFPTLQERILLDCVRFYHLHSTMEAERLPIADWLLTVKSEGSAAQYQRKLSKIQQNKTKNGRR